jgi:ribokinase
MKPIVVVGSINMDLVSHTPGIPRPGETVLGTSFQLYPGGKGANQAVAVARLGYSCVLLGKVGNDVFGEQLLKDLNEYGVDISHVGHSARPSGTASIAVEESGQNSIIVTQGANSDVTVAYLEEKQDVIESAGMILSQLEIPLETVEWLAENCHKLEIPFVLDPAPARELSTSLLQYIDWFTPNESEAAFFAGSETRDESILDGLFQRGLRNVILKRGEQGALLASRRGEFEIISPYAVEVLDTTAAGDSFNGAFAVGMMRGLSAIESAQQAAAAAAISVTRHGAQPSMPTLQEVRQFIGAIA